MPSLRTANPNGASGFRVALYVRNQEYNAAAGFALGVVFLIWKMRP